MNIDFQLLFESAPGLYLILLPDKNFTIVAVSDSYANATMTSRHDILGRGLFEVFPDNPDDKTADGVSNLHSSLNSVLKNKATHVMAVQKYDIKRPDGKFEERYWSPLNKPLLNSAKEIAYIIHRVEDVTEFVRLKKEQDTKDKITEELHTKLEKMEMEIYKRAQEILLRNALDKMMEGVQIIGFDWRYIYVNDAVARQGKYSKEELQGNTMMEKYPGIENTDLFSVLQVSMKDRTTRFLENEFSYPDGSKGWFELSIQPVPEGLFILSIDITEKKKAHEKLLKAENEIRHFARHLNNVLEEERAHLAREIHDELGQRLAGIKIGIGSFKKLYGIDQRAEEKIAELMNEVDITIQSLRQIATELRPGILDSMGLIPSIEWLVKEFEKKTGIKCFMENDVEYKMFEKNLSTCFFRISQEALTNISKHAKASEIRIKTWQKDKELMLEISDNGKGISGEKLNNPFSMGLLGMRERANIIGADFAIKSEKGKGTTVLLKKEVN